jgi:acyltransferase 3
MKANQVSNNKQSIKPSRDLSYEFIRVIAMILIVFTHEIPNYLGSSRLATSVEIFATVGVTIFFLLAGKFAFRLNLEDKTLYKKYYWKKAIGLIVPMLVYMAIKNWHVMTYNKQLVVTPIFYVKHFIVSLFNGFYFMEYWFLYVLIALLIAVPFTAKMIQNFNTRDKKAFLIVSLVLATLTTFPPHLNLISGAEFAIKYHFIGYALFFYAGYFIEDFFKSKKSRTLLYFAGAISFIISVFLVLSGINNGYKSTSPFYFFFTIATFISLRSLGKKLLQSKSKNLLEPIISFLGKHSLGVYMIHMMFLFTLNDLKILPLNILGWFLSSFIILIVSVVACFILDNTIIKLLQKLFIKIFHLEKYF